MWVVCFVLEMPSVLKQSIFVVLLQLLRVLRFIRHEALRADGYEVYSVEQAHGSTKLQTFTPIINKKYAVILGNEVKGVHQEVVDASDGCLEIPQFGTKHSMNVSVTAGIVIWHFAMQKLL